MRKFYSGVGLAMTLCVCGAAKAQCSLTEAPVAGVGVTTYNYTLAGCNAKPAVGAAAAVPAAASVTIDVNSAFLPLVPGAGNAGQLAQQSSPGHGVTISFVGAVQANYTFSIVAQSNLSSAATTGKYSIVLADGTTTTGSIAVPQYATPDQITGLTEIATNESTVDVLLGIGSHITFSAYPDYTISTDSVLEATGVGNAIPELLVGAGFTTGAYKINTSCPTGCIWKKLGRHTIPDSLFVNVQVPLGATSANGSISGYTFGGGYKIQKFVEVMLGFSLAQYNEPSTGFRTAAAAVVTANAALPPGQQVPLYLRYSAADILADKPNALDGFPLLQQEVSGTSGGQIYPGSALLSHYRGGLFFGFAYPFSLTKLFKSQ